MGEAEWTLEAAENAIEQAADQLVADRRCAMTKAMAPMNAMNAMKAMTTDEGYKNQRYC